MLDKVNKQKLVVIGNGMAGIRTVEVLLDRAPHLYDITVFGSEPYGNYNRILLSPVLAGEKTVHDIMLNTEQWYEDNGFLERVITSEDGLDGSIDAMERAALVNRPELVEAQYNERIGAHTRISRKATGIGLQRSRTAVQQTAFLPFAQGFCQCARQ